MRPTPWETGRWGNKQNGLFRPGARMDLNACVGWNGGPAGMERYIEGYFEAANRLVRGLQDGKWGVDCIVYPLAMLYRHGIEMSLKRLWASLADVQASEESQKPTHDLIVLWNRVKFLLDVEAVTKEDLDKAETIVTDLAEIDSRGQVFRYPISTDGKMHLEETTLINIEVLADGMNSLQGFLSKQCDFIDWKIQSQRDMESDNRA